MRLQSLPILVLVTVGGCARAESGRARADSDAAETAATRHAIDSLNAAYAADQYVDDAEVVAGPMVLKGRAAITDWFNGGAAMGGTMKLTAVSVAASGPLAIERGVYTMTIAPPGRPQTLFEDGNYLIHWRRIDGRWLRVSQFASSPNPLRLPPPK